MTDAKEYAAVFRAAAEGVMRPYITQVKLPGGVTGVMISARIGKLYITKPTGWIIKGIAGPPQYSCSADILASYWK